MAALRLRVPSMLVLFAVLIGSPTKARAGDKFESWRAQMLEQVNKVWPGMATGDEILQMGDALGVALGATRDLERAAKDDGLSAIQATLVERTATDIERLREALTAFKTTYAEVAGLTSEMSNTVGASSDALASLVNDVTGKREEVVRSGFRVLQRRTNELESTHLKESRALEASLGAGFPGWRAQTPWFQPVERALDGRCQRMASVLQDTWDRVYDREKAVQAAQDGESGPLFELCLRGRLEEARQMLTNWRPPRLAFGSFAQHLEIPGENGWIDIVAHGSADSMTLELGNGQKYRVDAKTLFLVLKRVLRADDLPRWESLNDDEGYGFRLLSCSTGSNALGIAQALANHLGVPVKAPDSWLWAIRIGGRVVPVIHECEVCKDFRKPGAQEWIYDHVANAKDHLGAWRVFKPSNGEADAHIRSWLYELAKAKPWWQIRVTRAQIPQGKTAEDVLATLAKFNSALKAGSSLGKKALEALEKGRDFVALEDQTRDGALGRLSELTRLGMTARVEVMTEFKANFKNVKTD